MTSDYNKIIFTPQNTEPDLINYYMSNKDKPHPFIKYFPKNAISQSIISPPIYQEIHTGYNPHSKPIKSLNIPKNKYNNDYKTKSEYYNFDSPDFIDCEISMEDDYGQNNNNFNKYKYYSKSPTCNKNINPINIDYKSLSIIDENQNRARSPKIIRNNNFNLNDDDDNYFDYYNNNNNNELMLKSNSVSKFNLKTTNPLMKKQNMIYNNNNNAIQTLKDSYSTSNIHPMKSLQYYYRINPTKNQNIKNYAQNQISMSPSENRNSFFTKIRNNKQFDKFDNRSSRNILTSSTMISRSPNSNKFKNNYNNLLSNFSQLSNNSKINTNQNNLNNYNTNSNITNCQYLIDNPVPSSFRTILNYPQSPINNNMINPYSISELNNYIPNKVGNINSYDNNIGANLKLYKPKFHKNNINNIKTITTDRQYNQKYNINSSPKKNNNDNIIYENNNTISQSPKTIYQYYFQKSFSPNEVRYEAGNNSNSLNSKNNNFNSILNSNQYSNNIKSCLPKISNFDNNTTNNNNNSKNEFSSNNINDISFGDNLILDKNKKIKNFPNFSMHKINKSENLDFSNKLSDNLKDNEDIPFNNNSDINNLKQNAIFTSILPTKGPSDTFSQYMFEHINKIRINPHYFINNIKNAISAIAFNKKGNLYYDGKLKVALCKGKIAFIEAISFLEKAKPMKPLIYKKELCIPIPKKEKDFQSGDYLRKKINKIIMKGISVRAFWRDIIKDPEINFLLMVIDDNHIRRGAKRKDILNRNMKYIGINSGNIGNSFVSYIVLSDE